MWVCFISSLDLVMADFNFASPPLRFFLVPPPPHFPPPPKEAPFRPGIIVVVAVLATMFTLIFLLLIYARYFKVGIGSNVNVNGHSTRPARKNSGINRLVVESLPLFRFASLRGEKEGLECSVCLNIFESNQVLRLLPKCRHAFHVECVDTWLDAHSTCPLCRHRVDPEDVLVIQENEAVEEEEANELTRRVSGRHSSAGEKKSIFVVQIVVERPQPHEPGEGGSTQWGRKSVDSALSNGVRNDGLLITEREKRRRFEHRIVWESESGSRRRWSDLRPSDVLNVQRRMMNRGGGLQLKSLSVNSRFANNGRGNVGARCSSSVE